jgi:uncharacterized protein (DUF1330 family)
VATGSFFDTLIVPLLLRPCYARSVASRLQARHVDRFIVRRRSCSEHSRGGQVDVSNEVLPTTPRALEFFGAPEDGPFVMLNLLRFREFAQYEDGRDASLSGREAYLRYADGVTELVVGLGGAVHFTADVTGILLGEVEDLWDAVALVEYPSLAAFREMAMSPAMHAIEVHRLAGLAGQLNLKTKALP